MFPRRRRRRPESGLISLGVVGSSTYKPYYVQWNVDTTTFVHQQKNKEIEIHCTTVMLLQKYRQTSLNWHIYRDLTVHTATTEASPPPPPPPPFCRNYSVLSDWLAFIHEKEEKWGSVFWVPTRKFLNSRHFAGRKRKRREFKRERKKEKKKRKVGLVWVLALIASLLVFFFFSYLVSGESFWLPAEKKWKGRRRKKNPIQYFSSSCFLNLLILKAVGEGWGSVVNKTNLLKFEIIWHKLTLQLFKRKMFEHLLNRSIIMRGRRRGRRDGDGPSWFDRYRSHK